MRLENVDRRALLGLASLLFGGVLIWLCATNILHGLVSPQSTHVQKVQFANAKQLHKGDDVRIDGVASGQVDKVTPDPGRRTSTVTMKIDDDAAPIYRDARATARWKTVLGGKFYIDIDPGDPHSGKLGSATIPARQTESQVELDDITSVLQPNAVKGLRTLPGELKTALSDTQAPGTLLNTVADVSPAAEKGLGALRGVDQDRDLRGLIANTAATVRALDGPDDNTRKLIAGAAATLQTTGRRAADLQRTIAKAPSVLSDSRTTFTRLDSTLQMANPLLGKLVEPAGQVAPTLARLHPTLTGANRLLHRAEPLLDHLRPAAQSLEVAAKSGRSVLTDLQPSFDRLQQTILPMLSEKDPQTTKSTAVMIGGTFEGLAAGAGGQMDMNGHFIRFPATSGNTPLYSLPCQVYFSNPDAKQMLACQTLQEALKTYLNYSPLGQQPGTEPPDPSGKASARKAGR